MTMKPKKCSEYLVPCPICGAKAILMSDFGQKGCQTAYVTCSRDRNHVAQGLTISDSCVGGTERSAIIEWNEYAKDLIESQQHKDG